jgi:uncharacterized damage-inducible protein DinB
MSVALAVSSRAGDALARLLDEMAEVVAQLTHGEYAWAGLRDVSGSIGGHVRHCLDHVRALERAVDSGLADYDGRVRQTQIERDREVAVLALTAAARRMTLLDDETLDRAVVVRAQLEHAGPIVESASTIGRELAFVVNHTIHHAASIALLARVQGHTPRAGRFGLAPTTPALSEATCAR